jgi:hypothetical protein
MNEDALRALVRESIARHLGTSAAGDSPRATPLTLTGHSSHYRYLLPESDGPCLIEPTVRCNRCGYCESHGH